MLNFNSICFRFFKKTEGELRHQANVSAPLSRPPPTAEPIVKPSTSAGMSSSLKEPIAPGPEIVQPLSPNLVQESQERPNVSKSQEMISPRDEMPSPAMKSTENIATSVSSSTEEERLQNEDMDVDFEYTSESNSSARTTSTEQSIPQELKQVDPIVEPEETIVFVSHRLNLHILEKGK